MGAAELRGRRGLVGAAAVLAFVAAIFAAGVGTAQAALPGWNARIKFFDAALSMPAGSGPGALSTDETVTTIFHQGEIIWAFCQYEYAKVPDPKSFSPWSLIYLLDGKTIETKHIGKYEVPHATPYTSLLRTRARHASVRVPARRGRRQSLGQHQDAQPSSSSRRSRGWRATCPPRRRNSWRRFRAEVLARRIAQGPAPAPTSPTRRSGPTRAARASRSTPISWSTR